MAQQSAAASSQREEDGLLAPLQLVEANFVKLKIKDYDDDDLSSAGMSMVQRHANCAYKKKKKKRNEKSLVYSLSKSHFLITGRSSAFS